MIGMFPSDHVIADEKHFRQDIQRAAEIASKGANIVVIGIPPTRAETGYGYIEAGSRNEEGRVAGAALHREALRRRG